MEFSEREYQGTRYGLTRCKKGREALCNTLVLAGAGKSFRSFRCREMMRPPDAEPRPAAPEMIADWVRTLGWMLRPRAAT